MKTIQRYTLGIISIMMVNLGFAYQESQIEHSLNPLDSNQEKNMQTYITAKAGFVNIVFIDEYLVKNLSNVLIQDSSYGENSSGKNKEYSINKAKKILGNVGLSKRLDQFPSNLSVGEQQRIAIARAAINEPQLILADEPTGNLDDENTEMVCQHLATHADNGGIVLLATHDQRVASYARNIVQMSDGAISTGT